MSTGNIPLWFFTLESEKFLILTKTKVNDNQLRIEIKNFPFRLSTSLFLIFDKLEKDRKSLSSNGWSFGFFMQNWLKNNQN